MSCEIASSGRRVKMSELIGVNSLQILNKTERKQSLRKKKNNILFDNKFV